MCFNGGFTRNQIDEIKRRAQKAAVNHGLAPFIENKRYGQQPRPACVVVNRNGRSVYQTECDFASHEPRGGFADICVSSAAAGRSSTTKSTEYSMFRKAASALVLSASFLVVGST